MNQNQETGAEAGDRSREAMAQQIMAYLRRNPKAEDDLIGIARWWLLEQQIRTAVARVQEALEWLLRQNLITARRGIDGRISYRLQGDQDGA